MPLSTNDPGDHFKDTAWEPGDNFRPQLQMCKISPCDNSTGQKATEGLHNVSDHFVTNQQFACIQLHPKVNSTAEERIWVQKYH